MKAAETRDMSDHDLETKLKESRVELFNLRFQHATGQLDNPGRIGSVKKDIARLHTEVRARELKAERDAAGSKA
jgi:large subunit ribosomal protein L29